MSLAVLQSRDQVSEARAELERRGLSCLTPGWKRALQRRHLWPGYAVGDWIKSWDLWKTVALIDKEVPRSAPILDIGAVACEALPVLSRWGYTDLVGIDLDESVSRMPALPGVRWVVGDMNKAPFPDASFAAVTAVSVIEHGYQPEALFSAVSRLLRPGGLFIASFDYWPKKLDTAGVLIFGLDWRIFSEEEARGMLADAARHGLEPLGSLDFAAARPPVDCMGRSYTFGWTALRKKA